MLSATFPTLSRSAQVPLSSPAHPQALARCALAIGSREASTAWRPSNLWSEIDLHSDERRRSEGFLIGKSGANAGGPRLVFRAFQIGDDRRQRGATSILARPIPSIANSDSRNERAARGLAWHMYANRRVCHLTSVHLPYFATAASENEKPRPGSLCSTIRPSLCVSWRSMRRRKFKTWSS